MFVFGISMIMYIQRNSTNKVVLIVILIGTTAMSPSENIECN